MGSFDPNFFYIPDEEEIDNVFPVEEQETLRQSYSLGGGSRNNLGGAFSYVQSDPLTASQGSSYPTSQTGTSLTSPIPEYGASSGITVRQEPQPVPPGINERGLIYMEGGDTRQINEQILDHTAFDLELEPLVGVPLQTPAPRQGPLVGIPGHDTQTASPKMEELRMQVRFLGAALHRRTAESLFSEEDVDWIMSLVRQCNTRVVEKKRNVGHRISKQPASKARNGKTTLRCIKCRTQAGTSGALQRHIEDKHHPRVSFSCPEPGCTEVSHRKDKFRDHCQLRHSWRLTNEEMGMYTQHLDVPPHCSICSLMVSDWKSFYQCFISHCGIGHAYQDEVPSLEDDPDNEGPENGSSFYGLGMGGADKSVDQGNNNNHNYAGSSTQDLGSFYSTQNYNQNLNQYGSSMKRSSSDGVPLQPEAHHDINQKRRASVQDNPGLPRELQQLGLPPKRQVKRPKQARAEPQENRRCPRCGHEFNNCRLCQKRPVSVDNCHACSESMRAQASASSSQVVRHIAPNQGSMNPPPVIVIPIQQQMRFPQNLQVPRSFGNGNRQPPRHPGNYGRPTGNPQGTPRGSYDFTTNVAMIAYVPDLSEEEMLPTRSKSSNASFGGGTWLSCLPIRVPPLPMGMVKVPQEAKALEYGVGSGAIDQTISQTISETIPPQTNLPVAKLGTISPELCRCPCRTKTAGTTYSSNARVELIPGKLLDMTLTILPEDRVGHPLRTRIRVVVKLLKLRSSVARSGNKKKNKQDAKEIELVLKTSLDGSAPTAPVVTKEEPVVIDESDISESEDDGTFSDAESDTSSVAEASSVSELALVPFKRSHSDILSHDDPDEDIHDTSDLFSDIQFLDDDSEEISQPAEPSPDDLVDEMQSLSIVDPNDYEIEETELEISLDLDLQTCLKSLSSWTDGLAEIEQLGNSITDPARVFEYFFRYIIYVIFALSRSRIEAAGR